MKTIRRLWQRFLHRVYGSIGRTWSWGTAVLGILLLAAVLITGMSSRIGFGLLGDGLVFTAVAAVLFLLTVALNDLILGVLSLLPRRFAAWSGAMALFLFIALYALLDQLLFALVFTAVFCAVQWLLGGALYVLFRVRRRVLPALLVVLLGLGFNGALVGWLLWPGTESDPGTTWQMAGVDLSHLAHPGQDGPHSVRQWTYGAGANQRRPEYRPAAVAHSSTTVDASAYLPDLTGYKETLRRWFWGFDQTAFPLNGLVWFPDGEGPFPLVLIVHGNHQMEDFSDPGYEYLGRFLASRGYIAVSVDQNFLNGSWSGSIGTDNDARAWVLLKHLEQWRLWTEDPEHDLYGSVDLENIALIGHSRGGEAAAIAAAFNGLTYYPDDASEKFDFGFSIQAVVAIAPSYGQYRPANTHVPLENVHYLALQGSLDSDVHLFMGQSAYQRLRFTDGQYWVKAAIYLHGANHGQFNTEWGRKDMPPPLGAVLKTAPIMDPSIQREAAKVYIGAFLEGTLAGNTDYFDLLRYAGSLAQFGITNSIVSQFADSTWMAIADFSEDIDLTTTTLPGGTIAATGFDVWRQRNPVTSSTTALDAQAVELVWSEAPARYSLHLPLGWFTENVRASVDSLALVFNLADGRSPEADQVPLTPALVLRDENPGSIEIRLEQWNQQLPPNVPRQFTKAAPLERRYNSPFEMVPQTFFIPLQDLAESHPDFVWQEWSGIELQVPSGSSGKLWIESIGLMEL